MVVIHSRYTGQLSAAAAAQSTATCHNHTYIDLYLRYATIQEITRHSSRYLYRPRTVAQRLWYCFQHCLFVTLSVPTFVCLYEPLENRDVIRKLLGHHPMAKREAKSVTSHGGSLRTLCCLTQQRQKPSLVRASGCRNSTRPRESTSLGLTSSSRTPSSCSG